MKNCPNCNKITTFAPNPKKFGLISWEKESQGVVVDVQNILPVKIENCTECGYLNLYFDSSMQNN